MRTVVLDASLALALVLPDESSARVERLLREQERRSIDIVTAPHWMIELQNGVLQAARRRRIARTDRVPALDLLASLPVRTLSVETPAAGLLALADREGLSAYDAVYLALALERGALLATADKRLAAAARGHDILWP